MDVTSVIALQTQTPSFWEYVIVGYVVAAGAIGGFVIHTVRRGRRLSRQVPADKRRWL